MDRVKQTSIDLIHSSRRKIHTKFSHQKYTSPFNISIVSWNVNATEPSKLNLKACLKHVNDADLVVFGIQEMMDLNPNNIMLEEDETKLSGEWEK